MRNMMIKMTSLVLLLAGSALFAQRNTEPNEDLQFIKSWQHAQKLVGLADALLLTDEQIATLKTTRAAIDAVQEDYAGRVADTRAAGEAVFSEVRTNIETTDTFSDEDKAALKEAKMGVKLLNKEIKMRAAVEAVALEGLLSDEQEAALRSFFKGNKRGQGKRQGANANANDNANANNGQGQRARNGKGKAVRILLSDEFLAIL